MRETRGTSVLWLQPERVLLGKSGSGEQQKSAEILDGWILTQRDVDLLSVKSCILSKSCVIMKIRQLQ